MRRRRLLTANASVALIIVVFIIAPCFLLSFVCGTTAHLTSSSAPDYSISIVRRGEAIFRRPKRLVLAAEDPDSPGHPILLPLVSDSFVPNCGADDEDEDGVSELSDQSSRETSPVTPTPSLPPAVWLGYSSKLFGGFFNLTITGGEVRPFGRCVASSQKFSLIEQQSQQQVNSAEHDRCYRCMFVDRRSSPHVVQMRTTPLQCLASPNNAGADTLYRVCASLSPSLPLLTLLRISEAKSVKCPFETGNYRVSYEFSGCLGSPGGLLNNQSPNDEQAACIDNHGVHLHLAVATNSQQICDGQLRGAVSLHCLASWKAETGDHHSFAFLRLNHGQESTIRCAIYHHQRRHHFSSGFALAIASGFDCSELNGVLLKSTLINRNHLNKQNSVPNHIFHFNPIISETTTTPVTMTTTSTPGPTTITTILDNTKHHRENNGVSLFASNGLCDLPSFLLMAKNWHSIDASSYQLVPASSSSFTLFIGNGNNNKADRTALYLNCVEPEIGGDPSSRIYQAVYAVSLNNPGKILTKRNVANEFSCGSFLAKNVSSHVFVEVGTAKRAQRQQPTSSTSTTPTKPQRHRTPKLVPTYHRCVKFYQRDRHVVELVLGSASNGPTSLVCADTVKEDHRVLLVDGGIFMGYSSDECLSIPLPGFLSGQHPLYYQKNHHRHLQTSAIKTPPVEDVLNPACLVRLCDAIISQRREDFNNQEQQLSYLVFRKGSICPAEADPDVTLFYALQRCAYRWRRDYVTDNLLFAPIVKMASNNEKSIVSPLSCFILQHNGISSTISTLIPNPNCWLNGQVNFTSAPLTSNSNNNNTTSPPIERDEFIGFAFNAQEACHWPSQSPTFVNSNSDDGGKNSKENNAADEDSIKAPPSFGSQSDSSRETGDNFYENAPKLWRSHLTLSRNNAARSVFSLYIAFLLSTSLTPFILFLNVNL